ncbi:tetratricopeptide repeat protein [Magnetococcus sp. PR-3]|uniref:tetratricopeptide repeat protein n=1 Tax=Magnetococcus sp. PR-3 TaxID=3120355 RepID=UPI002FCE667D
MARKKKQKKAASKHQPVTQNPVPSAAQPPVLDQEQRRQQALELHRSGAWQPAEQAYAELLKEAPEDAELNHFMGLLHYQQQHYKQALPYLNKVVALRPEQAFHHYHLGLSYMGLGAFDQAKQTFHNVLRCNPNHGDALLNLGVIHHKAGELKQAEQAWLESIRVTPRAEGGYLNLASFYQEQKQWEHAQQVLRNGLNHLPNAIALVHKLAQVHTALGQHAEALPLYHKVAQAKPEDIDTQRALGLTLNRVGAHAQCLNLLEQVAKIDGGQLETLSGMGASLKALGQLDEACQIWREILNRTPHHNDALFHLSLTLFTQGKLAEAEPLFARMAALNPHSPDAFANWGHCLSELERFEEAEQACRHALRLDPAAIEAGIILGGRVLRRLYRLEEAVEVCRTHVAHHPGNPRVANNLAMMLLNVGEVEGAKQVLEEILAHHPDYNDSMMNLSVIQLVQGQLREGFHNYQSRYHTKLFRKGVKALNLNRSTLWEGQELNGKSLVVLPEQGLGDQLQMIRYLPELKKRGVQRLELSCSQPLAKLFQQVPGIDNIYTDSAHVDLSQFDYYCMDMNLPHGFATELQSIPASIPYLHAQEADRAVWKKRLDAACTHPLRIGLVWAGNPNHERDRARSIPLQTLAPLLALEGVTWVSLQLNNSPHDRQNPLWDRMVHLEPHVTDFAQTAGLMANLDLMISVDTSVVHLAGAMGCPVWTLIAYSPDWRWLLDRDDSPWYPSMRLFRQSTRGDWPEVMDRVSHAVTQQFDRVHAQAETSAPMHTQSLEVASPKPDQQMFFCFGPPKSGTTLLQYLLDQHPQISCPAEHAFAQLKKMVEEGCLEYAHHHVLMHSRIGGLGKGGVSPLLAKRSFRFMVESLIRDSGEGLPIIGANDNQVLDDLQGYYQDFDQPKMVAIFRDPIDVAISSWNHNHHLAKVENNEELHLSFMKPFGGLEGWAANAVAVFNQAVDQVIDFYQRYGDIHVVRYDRLVKHKRQTCQQLFDYLGAEYDDGLLDHIEQVTSLEAMRNQAQHSDFFRSGSMTQGAGLLDDKVRAQLLQRAQPAWDKLAQKGW